MSDTCKTCGGPLQEWYNALRWESKDGECGKCRAAASDQRNAIEGERRRQAYPDASWASILGRPLFLLALLLACPAAAQPEFRPSLASTGATETVADQRRWRVEEAVPNARSCYKAGLSQPPVCVPLNVRPGVDPYRGERQRCAGQGVAAESFSRWGEGFFHRGDAACSWASGHGPPPSAEEVIRALVGDPSYDALCVEELDATATCNQGIVAATAARLQSGGTSGGGGLPSCTGAEPYSRTPRTSLRCRYFLLNGRCREWTDWSPPHPECCPGISCPAIEPPPPPPPDLPCDGGAADGACTPRELAAGTCPTDCEPPVEPPDEPAGCEALRLAVEEVCRGE